MAQTFTHLLTHIIFSTKSRHPYLDADIRPRVFAYIGGITREIGAKALIVNGMADHVHILASLPPILSVADALRLVKANSSRWINEKWALRRKFAWQTGYAAFSVSESNADAVMKYIAEQEKHHRRMTFTEELVLYLKKHGIPYDDRYLQ